ncbi:MAG TPA: polysaccharide deacetylase family protein [bacterium]
MSSKARITLSTFKRFCRSAVALSFDYETSAPYGNIANFSSRVRGRIYAITNKVFHRQRDLSFYYGMGYAMRKGTEKIIKIFNKYGIHATWFANGHALLKDNNDGKAYRINQILPYAIYEAGFTDIVTWRKNRPTFFYAPNSDYKKFPYWYFGDQAEILKEMGEDIQCHTFSHPYIVLEEHKNVAIDLEDWQNAAVKNGFKRANILSLPFCGDAYRNYYDLNLLTALGKEIAGQKYDLVYLPNDIINIMMSNGFDLITRCGSKIGKIKNFSKYNDSELYYMSDINFYDCFDVLGSLSGTLKKIVENKSAVNIWLHPSDILAKNNIGNFEALIQSLINRSNGGEIWLATISQIWDHFKKVKACDLNVTVRNGKDYDVVVVNKTASVIVDLGLDIYPPDVLLVSEHDNLEQKEGRISIKRLHPDVPFKLTGQLRR